jgi:hypothetical protein
MDPPTDSKFNLLKLAVDTRQFEIQLFWQRSNYFLVLNTAIAVGFFGRSSPVRWQSFVLAAFGIAVSCLWVLVSLGSRYWQVRWEMAANRMERDYAPNAKLFAASPEEVKQEVKRGLGWPGAELLFPGQEKLIAWVDAQVLRKPSVGLAMIVLSLMFVVLWAVVCLGSLIY